MGQGWAFRAASWNISVLVNKLLSGIFGLRFAAALASWHHIGHSFVDEF